MNIGDYVRTDKGLIAKYNVKKEYVTIPLWQGGSKTEEQEIEYINNIPFNRFIHNIIKSSPNIIDLIEVGDYVNGFKVNNIEKKESGDVYIDFDNKTSYLYVKNWNYESRIEEYKIKSILTKEQYESMSYKVGVIK